MNDVSAPALTNDDVRSTKMHTLHEALARERTRDEQRRAYQSQLARELVAQRRWHRVSLRARSVEARHAHRVQRLQAR